MQNVKLEQLINQKLNQKEIRDYMPNGLQVEGRQEVQSIITGVTACQILLNKAISHNADAIIVHHGYFWEKEDQIIRGIKYQRLKSLLSNNINLYAWHLPLDIHPKLGNNIQLALALGINVIGPLGPLVLHGKFISPINGEMLRYKLEQVLKRKVLHCSDNAPEEIKYLAWCTGSGQNFINLAGQAGVDAFITGEISEHTVHLARELGIHFYAAGHHATERGGIIALGLWLVKHYNLDVIFIDIPNPA